MMSGQSSIAVTCQTQSWVSYLKTDSKPICATRDRAQMPCSMKPCNNKSDYDVAGVGSTQQVMQNKRRGKKEGRKETSSS